MVHTSKSICAKHSRSSKKESPEGTSGNFRHGRVAIRKVMGSQEECFFSAGVRHPVSVTQ